MTLTKPEQIECDAIIEKLSKTIKECKPDFEEDKVLVLAYFLAHMMILPDTLTCVFMKYVVDRLHAVPDELVELSKLGDKMASKNKDENNEKKQEDAESSD